MDLIGLFLSCDRFYILSLKAHVISGPPLATPDKGLETSKFSVYFSSCCIPTNESLFIILTLPILTQTVEGELRRLERKPFASFAAVLSPF
jgi:hypothetical protein